MVDESFQVFAVVVRGLLDVDGEGGLFFKAHLVRHVVLYQGGVALGNVFKHGVGHFEVAQGLAVFNLLKVMLVQGVAADAQEVGNQGHSHPASGGDGHHPLAGLRYLMRRLAGSPLFVRREPYVLVLVLFCHRIAVLFLREPLFYP